MMDRPIPPAPTNRLLRPSGFFGITAAETNHRGFTVSGRSPHVKHYQIALEPARSRLELTCHSRFECCPGVVDICSGCAVSLNHKAALVAGELNARPPR